MAMLVLTVAQRPLGPCGANTSSRLGDQSHSVILFVSYSSVLAHLRAPAASAGLCKLFLKSKVRTVLFVLKRLHFQTSVSQQCHADAYHRSSLLNDQFLRSVQALLT